MKKDLYFEYHLRQYKSMYRSTFSLINFLKKRIPDKPYYILDVGCGGGANIYWLKKHFPRWRFLGIDIDREALKIANKMQKRIEGVEFQEINFLKSHFKKKSFDYVFAIQFISSVDFDFPIFLKKALTLAKKGIFLTSLFSEGWLEQYTTAYDIKENWKGVYKIYSLERFKEALRKIGGNVSLEYERFNIDIDLPKPSEPKFGTYTEKTKNGKRLQISGYMLMPWYNILVKIIDEKNKNWQ
jgi:ubiquinone/menaquinone biosynthesis C-methylase UbiE